MVKVNGHVGILSDYRFRGLTLSDEEPVLQGSLVASIGGFYAGAWSSPIDLPDGDVEIDVFTGYNFSLPSQSTLTLQVAGITFPGEPNSSFFRASAGVSKNFDDIFTASLRVDYEPEINDTFRAEDDNIYISSSANSELGRIKDIPINLSLGLGYENGSAPLADDKFDWNVGLGIELLDLAWTAQYIDTDVSGEIADATLVLSVVKNF